MVGTLLSLFTTIAQASDVKVLGNESMPYCGLVEGKPAGLAVDMLNAATREGAPRFEFDFTIPWTRAQLLVHEQPTLAIIPFTRTAEREKNYKWIADLFSFTNRVVTVGRATPLKTIEEAVDLETGILNGSAFVPIATELGFKKLRFVTTDLINAKKLAAGHLDAWIISQYQERYLYAQVGGDPAKLQMGPALGETRHIYIAADLKFPDAEAKAIYDAVERLRAKGELEKILQTYR